MAKMGFALGICLAALIAGGAVASDRDPIGEDIRLDQKVTLELGLVTLEQFAQAVSKQTGVTIVVGIKESDWQVKERKTVVFAKDVPAKEVLLQVAELHHYTLSGYGEGDKRYYRIWQDLKARQEEEKLRERAEAEPLEVSAAALDEMASLHGAADKMAPDELARLEKSDPYKHFLLSDSLGQAACGVAAEIPTYVRAAPEGWSVRMAEAEPSLYAAVCRYLEEVQRLGQRRNEGLDERDYIPIAIRFDLEDSEGNLGMGIRGQLDIGYPGGSCEISLSKPGSLYRQIHVRVVKAARAGIDPAGAIADISGMKLPDPLEDAPLKDNPIFEEVVKIEKPGDYAGCLQAVYEKTGLTVLSDSYWEKTSSEVSGEVPIKNLLRMILLCDRSISVEGSTLAMSDNRWYEKRAAEIPDCYLNFYEQKAKTAGLDVEDLKRIALDLNDAQVKKNLLYREVFEECKFYLGGTRQLAGMRFIACLTDRQKDAITVDRNKLLAGMDLSSTYQLPAKELSPKVLQYALEAVGMDVKYLAGRAVTFSCYSEPKPLLQGMQRVYVTMNLLDRQGNKESLGMAIHIPGTDWFERTKRKNAGQE